MAFTVETGTGSSTSNSYASVAEADAYFTDRGYTSQLAASTAEKQQALIAATDYIDAMFAFSGSRVNGIQALSWPRSGANNWQEGTVYGTTTIPEALKKATIELAGKVLNGAVLIQDLDRGGRIKSLSVGPISVTYADDAPVGISYGIFGLLKGLLVSSSEPLHGMPVSVEASPDVNFMFSTKMFDNNR